MGKCFKRDFIQIITHFRNISKCADHIAIDRKVFPLESENVYAADVSRFKNLFLPITINLWHIELIRLLSFC